jgi:hypothetical protein
VYKKIPDFEKKFVTLQGEIDNFKRYEEKNKNAHETMMLRLQTTPRYSCSNQDGESDESFETSK